MLTFQLNSLEQFSHAISILQRYEDIVYLKSSPFMLSIISQITPRCIVALQLLPQFFTRFTCNQIHYFKFSIDDFFTTMLDMQRDGFSSLILVVSNRQYYMHLEYRNPRLHDPSGILIRTRVANFRHENEGKVDYSLFVSIELDVFRNVLRRLNDASQARVTLTDSEIKFSSTPREISLTTQGGECIIGGVGVGDQIQSALALNPIEFYYNFTSKRLWLFKSIHFNRRGLVLIAPIGLYARISSYFSQRF